MFNEYKQLYSPSFENFSRYALEGRLKVDLSAVNSPTHDELMRIVQPSGGLFENYAGRLCYAMATNRNTFDRALRLVDIFLYERPVVGFIVYPPKSFGERFLRWIGIT